MSDIQTLYCRLCAIAKPCSDLVNLQTDEDRRRNILEKLSQLCIVVPNLESLNDNLAKTVCTLCIYSLDNAFDFVTRARDAQSKLFLQHDLKKENDEIYTREPTVKEENHLNVPEDCLNIDDLEICPSSNFLKQRLDLRKHNETFAESCHFDNCNDGTIEYKKILKSVQHTEIISNKSNIDIKVDNNYHNKDLFSKAPSQLFYWKDYSWMCAYCDTLFPHFEEMRNHSMQYHGCCNVYRCIDCKSRKFHLDRFLRHIYTHRKHLSLSCYKCHAVFSTVKSLQNHKETHMVSTDKCYGCNETFKNLDELIEHRDQYKKRYKHPLSPALQQLADNLTCVKCQKTFNSRVSLKQHLMLHADRPRDFICDKCGKSFVTKGEVAQHLKVHEDFKPYQCKTCKRSFRNSGHLHEHISVHEGQKPFSCDQCGKKFRLKKYLNSHVSVHTDFRPWICTICNKGFRFKHKLIDHKRQHTGEKPYACKICERAFTNWPNYNKHLKAHTINKDDIGRGQHLGR